MGFCIFNYAAVAAHYAIAKAGVGKVAILDFDVHFGNGVAALVEQCSQARYCSLHQLYVFPLSGSEQKQGPLKNLRSIGVPAFSTYAQYEPLLDRALGFLCEQGVFEPDLLIVCAGFDALRSDPMAGVSLEPADYGKIAGKVQEAFGALPVVYGLEGGYNLDDLPLAVESVLLAYAAADGEQ